MMYTLPDTVYTLPILYKESFFSENELLHPELAVSSHGVQAILQPYTPSKDNYFILATILLATLAICLFQTNRHFLRQQSKNFFLPPSNQRSNDLYSISKASKILFAFLLALSGTFICFSCLKDNYDFNTYKEIWYILAQISLMGILYFLLKSVLIKFTTWTFFHKEQRTEWQKNYAFLMALEALALVPLQIFSSSTNLDVPITFLCVATIIIITKFALLYKCKVIFFPNFYGYLHLIMYFCATELGPMAILWVALTHTEQIFY